MKSDRFEVLDRLTPLLDAPEPSIEGFLRRRDRKRRNQRILAGAVGVALFVVPVTLIAVLSSRDRTQTPGGRETEPGVVVVDQAFVDGINSCERPLVTRQQVETALGFRPNYVAPFAAGKARPGAAQIESGGGVTVGCQYMKDGTGGEVVISAYTADAPPRPPDRSEPVQGIGDEARFSPYGNGDSHTFGPEGATSILQVRSGDLILRFNGRGVDTVNPNLRLPALRQLADDALTTVDIIRGAPEVDDEESALSRIVGGIPFSFSLPTSGIRWEPGPIERLPDPPGGFRSGRLYVSKSTVGPQGAEAIVLWTGFPDGNEADPCANLPNPTVRPSADELAAAVATAPGTELVTGPSDISVGGYPAKYVVLTVREDLGCDPGFFYTWQDEMWGPFWSETNVGDTIRVWIIDVDGTLLFIEAETTKQAGPRLEQEIGQIVDSIRFD